MFRSLLSRLSGRFVGRRVPSPAPSPSSPPTLLRPAGAEKESGKSIHIGPDVVLYRSAANVLKTDDTFDAKDLKIEGKDIFRKLIEDYILYWTFFDSIDGLYTSTSGSGNIDLSYWGAQITTGSTQNSYARLRKDYYYTVVNPTWNKKRIIATEVFVLVPPTATGDKILIITGDDADNERKLGFKIVGNGSEGELYGVVGDGSGESTLYIQTVDTFDRVTLLAILYPGDKAEFYVNGSYKGSLTSHLPSGTTDAAQLMCLYAANPSSTDNIGFRLSEWRFLQLP